MRNLVALLLLFAASGCVRVRVAQADYENRSCVVCGNRHAGMGDLQGEANRFCNGTPARLLRCSERAYGTVAHASGNQYGATAVSTNLVGNCCEYRCE